MAQPEKDRSRRQRGDDEDPGAGNKAPIMELHGLTKIGLGLRRQHIADQQRRARSAKALQLHSQHAKDQKRDQVGQGLRGLKGGKADQNDHEGRKTLKRNLRQL
jgi:hypothetical protein